MSSVVCVVQARTGSSRLPGKVLADLGGRPMLAFMLGRLSGIHADRLVVATSERMGDDAVAQLAARSGADVVRGSEHDVLARFGLVLSRFPADTVVRLTADCPLIDPGVVNEVIATHAKSGADYTSNTLIRTFPEGLDVEVLAGGALTAAASEAFDPNEREHVTPFVYRSPERFRLAAVCSEELLGDERWTVDTAEDLDRVRLMVDELGNGSFSWRDVLAVRPPAAVSPTGVHLRPARPLDGPGVPPPYDDPGERVWAVEVDGLGHGWVRVAVAAGEGQLRMAMPGRMVEERAVEFLKGLQDRLRADYQVRVLAAPAAPFPDRVWRGVGFAVDAGVARWVRR